MQVCASPSSLCAFLLTLQNSLVTVFASRYQRLDAVFVSQYRNGSVLFVLVLCPPRVAFRLASPCTVVLLRISRLFSGGGILGEAVGPSLAMVCLWPVPCCSAFLTVRDLWPGHLWARLLPVLFAHAPSVARGNKRRTNGGDRIVFVVALLLGSPGSPPPGVLHLWSPCSYVLPSQ